MKRIFLSISFLTLISMVGAMPAMAQNAPTLDPIPDPAAILEDAGSQNVGLDGITDGGDGAQTLTVTATSGNTALIPNPTVTYSSPDATGSLDYTPVADASGSAVITVTVTDDDGSAQKTFTVNVTAVNDAPSFTKGADETVLEDAGAQSVVGWATGISAGPADEAGQTLSFNVSNDNTALFAAGPSINAAGDLSYTPTADANGSAIVTVSLSDDGGGTDTSADQTFNITVTAVNDVPLFIVGADELIAEDAGAQSVSVWATGISAGPADEAGQTLSFNVSNDNTALFAAGPSINAAGDLSYTPTADANGSAIVTVSLSDDGGGTDTSADQTFNITVTAVNDVPLFIVGADELIAEDAGAQSVSVWATGISAGPVDEAGQTLSFNVSNDNTALFALGAGPSITAAGDLSYTPAADANGSAIVTVSLSDNGGTTNGGVDTSADQTFNITVTAVNDVPSFTKIVGADQLIAEDAGGQSVVGWATLISAGPADESGQTLSFNVSNDNTALFALGAGPSITAAGDLSYTPAADANGSAIVTVSLSDNGGTTNGGVDTSADQTFNITVTAVNDVPSFTKIVGADQLIAEDAGGQSVVGWATLISAGPADESGQTLSFNVSNDNTALFALGAGPSITAAGDLSYTPAADANGSAIVTVSLSDNGGTTNGGVDTSADQTFNITVTAVNDVPSFTKGADQTVLEDAGAKTVLGWATAISAGPADESGQTLSFNVSNDNTALFALGAGPSITAAGDLSYTPAADANGSAIVTVSLSDNGGTTNGGVDTSADQTFNITVTAVNDVPSFTKIVGADQSIAEDAGGQSVVGWATLISAGPADESGQTLTFNVIGNTNPGLFAAGPAVDGTTGDLSYTAGANAFGTADITIELMDDGGTADGGVDTSAGQTFNITVTNVNDEPTFISGGDVITETGTGEQTVPWATGIDVGPDNENQTPSFIIVSSDCNPSLLVVGPSIDPDGTLRFTPVNFVTGTCTITTKLSDGESESSSETFTLELVDALPPIADSQMVETDGGNPLTIVLTGSDQGGGVPLIFDILEPVTDADTGEIISDTGPFFGVLDTLMPATNPDNVSADVVYSPNAPFISNAVIVAADSVLLKNNAAVLSGDVIVNNAGGLLDVRNGANTPSGYAAKADAIDIQNNAAINGDAFCNGGDYVANCDPLALPAFDPETDPFPPFLIGDVNANDVIVPKSQTDSLTPGIYGDILVDKKGTLNFAPGKYSVRSIKTGNDVVLQFSGATEIKVAERVVFGIDNTVGAASDVIFYVAGSDGTGKKPRVSVRIFNNSDVYATMYAPNGTIQLLQNVIYTGAMFAQNINVQNNAVLTLDNALPESPDMFSFEVTDFIGLVSETAVVLINADEACRNETGEIVTIAAFSGEAATEGATSIDITLRACESTDVPITFSLVDDGDVGSISGLPAAGVGLPHELVVTYTPSDSVPNDRDSFTFSVDNGSSIAEATVEINNPLCEGTEPLISSGAFATDEDNALTITLSGCDPDIGSTLSGVLTFSTDPTGTGFVDCASCDISAPVPITDNRPGYSSAQVVITHAEPVGTFTTFDYTATRTDLGAATATIDLEVNPAPVAPVAEDDSFPGTLGGVISGNVLDNDTDVNLDTLTATLVGSPPSHASVFTLNPDGSFVYTHNGTANFNDSFVYSASDGGLSDTATVFINIAAADITVTVDKSGPAGSEDSLITSTPAGISCGAGCTTDSALFTTTDSIRLDVAAATGFVFSGWSGDPDCIDGSIVPVADRNCTASFVTDTSVPPTGSPVVITVVKDGTGLGTVTSSPVGIDCGATCAATITGDPRITLSATAESGSVFAGFTGGLGNDCADGELEATVDTVCNATFTLVQATLTVVFSGGAGSVNSNPGGISCDESTALCTANFVNGQTVGLSARPNSGLPNGITWGGDCVTSGFPTLAWLVMDAANKTCTVDFP